MTNKRNYYAIIPADVRYDKRLNSSEKLLYGEITCLTNDTGVCWAQNSYFSELYGVSIRTVSRWLQTLSDNGYISVDLHTTETGAIINRYISIKERHPHDKNVYTPRQKCLYPPDKNVVENNKNIIINNNIKKNKQKESEFVTEFETVWNEYPKKVGKDKSLKYYIKARQSGVEYETILDGINRYKKQIELQETKRQFVKDGSTWFNNACWQDEYITESDNLGKNGYAGYDLNEYIRMIESEDS